MESGFSREVLSTVLCLPASEGQLAPKGLSVPGSLLPSQEQASLPLLWGRRLPWFPLAPVLSSLSELRARRAPHPPAGTD